MNHWRKMSRAVMFVVIALFSCKNSGSDRDFREEMRTFVREISEYAKATDSTFVIIPQNGLELVTTTGDASGPVAFAYLSSIDGVGREDLFYGYNDDDIATPLADRNFMIGFCDLIHSTGRPILVTDYCSTLSKMDDSYAQNFSRGYVSFAADRRELDAIPAHPSPIHLENDSNITLLGQIRNFLYLINPSQFSGRQALVDSLRETNYDLLLIDLFVGEEALTAADVSALKTKANGASRLVVGYMSIGEAEDYRYYWERLNQDLVAEENPNWPGNYVIRYWEPDWKQIIVGNDSCYTKKFLDAGFDGVYLDIIEAYESFE